MRIQRKHNRCLNCETLLDSSYNHCPKCGQLNNDNNVSFGTLFKDFFSNYFALDSRFTHSFKPFFIKPGYLTNKFNEGKRMSYANPVRLYLIVSLFFFFIFTNVGKKIVTDSDNKISTSSNSKDNIETSISDIDSVSMAELYEIKERTGLGFKAVMRTLPKEDKKKIIDKIGVDSAALFHIIPKDTVKRKKKTPNPDEELGFMDDRKFNWDLYDTELKENDDLTNQQILDSIYIDSASDLELLIAKQKIKVDRTETEYFIGDALKNLPIMMFVLLPIFALILKLLYVRRQVLYIKHLIHALHLHAFAYLVYGTTLLISFYVMDNNDWADWVNFFSFIIVSTYAYISFLRVYKQHWFKTLIKFNIQGLLYSIILMFAFAAEMTISFLLY